MTEGVGMEGKAGSTLYGPGQSRFARYLERRERERPDPVANELRRRVLAGLRGRVLEVGCGDGRSFELTRRVWPSWSRLNPTRARGQ